MEPLRPPTAAPSLFRRALPFYGLVALFALGFALFSGHASTLFGEQPLKLQGLAAAVGIAAGLVAVSRVGARIWAPMERAARAAAGVLGPLTLPEAVGLALLSGVAEELLFRGALWPTLNPWGTTLLFGLVHVIPRRSLWVYPVFALVAGLFLGMLRSGTGSLLPPMLAHVLVNAFNLVWLTRLKPQVPAAPAPPEPSAPPPDAAGPGAPRADAPAPGGAEPGA